MENLNYKTPQNDFRYYMSFQAQQIAEFAKSTITDRDEDKFSASYRDIINQIKERRNS